MQFYIEPMTRFELVTSSLPRKRSTPELHRRSNKKVSGRRDSNSRRSAWKADALPTELLPLLKRNTMISQAFNFKKPQSQYGNSSDCRHLRVKKVCGESRIRTCEDVISGFTVRPRWPLEYLPKPFCLMAEEVQI